VRGAALTSDEAIAAEVVREWLGADATISALLAMNSSTWQVSAGADRYVLKIAAPTDAPGLEVAAWLDAHGLRTGAPLRTSVRGDRFVALLRFVEGRELGGSDADVALVGETLGRAHSLLVGAPVPEALDRWPWSWLQPDLIEEPDLWQAAIEAIETAERLARTATVGILHGDPAPEAFIASDSGVALIDWGAACHGPLLYDVASALMYTGDSVLAAYQQTSPLPADELAEAPAFLAFRWAVQAWYFSLRRQRGDLTGLAGDQGNEEGLADARRGLIG
jgi:Ser/Thr protein kinase RdoA (MazF antagonist)